MRAEFIMPAFMEDVTAERIHQRMMDNLPGDIDDMPGGFPYDFTMPAALEKEEIINFHLARALMIAYPQYAWDEWLDLHGQQVHIDRIQPKHASGKVMVTGRAGAQITAGTVFCTMATENGPSIEFAAQEDTEIGENGTVLVPVAAVESGTGSNVAANTVVLMANPDRNIDMISNPESITGGAEKESDDDYYERIAAEYENSKTYIGNDSDYIRWAKEAGAGDCIVVPAAEGPGTVRLALVDANGQPANEKLVQDVYDHIVSPEDRSRRLLPTACAKLICVPSTTVLVDYTVTGLLYDGTTNLDQIKADFTAKVKAVYASAKRWNVLRYNDVRPIISSIAGVLDFDTFLMDGVMENINLNVEEYPETGILYFS